MSRWFFIFMGFAFLAVALAGFGPSYVFRLAQGEINFPLKVHLHAVLMFGWLGLFILQAGLIRRRNLKLHRTLGVVAVPWFVLIMLVSVFVSVQGLLAPVPPPLERLLDNIFFLQLCAFVLAPALFVLALRTRKTAPQQHKRYMFFLTFFLIEAAASRMTWLPGMADDDTFLLAQYAYLDLLLVPLVVFDLRVLGRLNRATVTGLVLLGSYQLIALMVWDSAWWLSTVNGIEAALGGVG